AQGSDLPTHPRHSRAAAPPRAGLQGPPPPPGDGVVAPARPGRQATPAVRHQLLAAATDAFVAGLTRSAWVAAAVAVGGAVAVWRGLPRLPGVPASPRTDRRAARSCAP
ncbi:hypothetical protein ABZ923_36190, partial [Streptomyces sp. NPDC046881]